MAEETQGPGTAPRLPQTTVDVDLENKGDDSKAAENDPRQGLPPSVRVEEGAPFQLDLTKREDPKHQYIQYNGVGTVRIMGPAEWRAAGIDSDDYMEWNSYNDKRIPRSVFSDEQLQYLLRIDDRFELVEVKPEPEEGSDSE